MIKKLGLYYRTVKHLKPIQIRYRLWYMVRNRFQNLTGHTYPLSIPKPGNPLNLLKGCPSPIVCHPSENRFTFINQSHTFEGAIDWNFSKNGKLWAYNLNYFDYLHQPDITKEEGLSLIREFIDRIEPNEEGLEPYPISLRGINWIKFLSRHDIQNEQIDFSLYAQYQILLDNLEYHILGNHLLENGCALLYAAYYFRDEKFLNKSKEILFHQLDEQILDDGAHFERSAMYHQILLERLLDCVNLLKNNNSWRKETELLQIMQSKVKKMLGWLQQVCFKNGDIPLVNDAAPGIAPSKNSLEDYAHLLAIKSEKALLKDSGYRFFQNGDFELFIDVGKIGPDYQPAHAHSDTFSFILYHIEVPVFIDTGISTYEANNRRNAERGTSAHNTVKYGDVEQSEVWKSFRVGRRAYPTIIEEGQNFLEASHNGYKHLNITHVREWKLVDNAIVLKDVMEGDIRKKSTAYFHIHPHITPRQKDNKIFQVDNIVLSFRGATSARIKKWQYPRGFNQTIEGYKLEVAFDQELETQITHSVS